MVTLRSGNHTLIQVVSQVFQMAYSSSATSPVERGSWDDDLVEYGFATWVYCRFESDWT
jgi:hypothetical protein